MTGGNSGPTGRRFSWRRADAVPNATNRLHKLAPAHSGAVEFAADVVDVDVHDVGAGFGFELPYIGEQFTAGDALTTAEHEVLEEGKLLGGEGDLPVSAPYLVIDAVEFEVARAKNLVRNLRTAAEEGPAARGELEKAKGLQQAVVGAHVEALDSGVEVAAAGEDQQSGIRTPRLEVSENFDAVAVRQTKIEDDQIRLVFGGVPKRRISIVQPLGGVTFVFYSFSKKRSEVRVILDNKYTHGSSPFSKTCKSQRGAGKGISGSPGTCFEVLLPFQNPPHLDLSTGN